MNILLRILLVIYAVCFIIISVLSVITVLNNEIATNFRQKFISLVHYSPIVFIIISLILLASAILFLIFALKTNKDKKAVSKYTNIGEVKISLNSIENIALSTVGKFSAVRNVRAFVSKVDDNVSVTIKALVLPDINIPVISNEIQEAVKNAVEESSGIMVSDVRVVIEDIYSGTLPVKKTE
jgi:uncharacterized alkaline shock family protein YloU